MAPATAHTCSVDVIRRSSSQHRRLQTLASSPMTQHQAMHQAIRQRIHDALVELDPAARELIVARFFRKEPLRLLATEAGVAAGTMSRRVGAALRALSEILTDMGVTGTDDLTLAEHFGDVSNIIDPASASLRFSPDWNSPELRPQGLGDPNAGLLPGWSRPLRVGVMVSYATLTEFSIPIDSYIPVFDQVRTTGRLPRQGVQLVSVVEPGTDQIGVVEATLRDYGLLGGLICADDAESLTTLDIMLLGNNFRMSPSVARAMWRAVRGGVRLINKRWTGSMAGVVDDPYFLDLMLADTPWFSYHHPNGCGTLASAIVQQSNPLLPGLPAGSQILMPACGPAYRPVSAAKVVLTQTATIAPSEHGLPALGSLQLPVWLSGPLGQGRVIVVQVWPHDRLASQLTISAEDYFQNLLTWAAEPRRVQG